MSIDAPPRPVTRYHGGKFRIASWIISQFPQHKVYVEPFGGAASVLMAKPRSDVEIYNDLDERMVNVFRVLRDRRAAAELERRLRLTPFSRSGWRLSYEPTDDPIEAARRVLVLQMMSFGTSGLVRHRSGFRASTHRNRSQDYSKDWANYPNAIRSFTDRLNGVTLECEPALKLLKRHDHPDVLFYCDPPYPHGTRSNVRGDGHNGYQHEMTDDDHRELAETLRASRGMVVVSGYACELYDDELYPDWKRVTRTTLAQGQANSIWRTEVLWLNRAAARNQQPDLFEELNGAK